MQGFTWQTSWKRGKLPSSHQTCPAVFWREMQSRIRTLPPTQTHHSLKCVSAFLGRHFHSEAFLWVPWQGLLSPLRLSTFICPATHQPPTSLWPTCQEPFNQGIPSVCAVSAWPSPGAILGENGALGSQHALFASCSHCCRVNKGC